MQILQIPFAFLMGLWEQVIKIVSVFGWKEDFMMNPFA